MVTAPEESTFSTQLSPGKGPRGVVPDPPGEKAPGTADWPKGQGGNLGTVRGSEAPFRRRTISLCPSNQLHLAFSTSKSHFITECFLKIPIFSLYSGIILPKESCEVVEVSVD